MKKIYLLLLPVVAVMALSCNNKDRDEAIAVGNKYMDAFMKVDVMEMAKYSSPKIADEFLRHYKEDTTGHHRKLREEVSMKKHMYMLDKHETEVKGDKAEVVYKISSEESKKVWAKVELDMMKLSNMWTVVDIDVDYPKD